MLEVKLVRVKSKYTLRVDNNGKAIKLNPLYQLLIKPNPNMSHLGYTNEELINKNQFKLKEWTQTVAPYTRIKIKLITCRDKISKTLKYLLVCNAGGWVDNNRCEKCPYCHKIAEENATEIAELINNKWKIKDLNLDKVKQLSEAEIDRLKENVVSQLLGRKT